MANATTKMIELLPSAARTATATGEAKALPDGAQDVGILMITTAFTSGTFTAKLQTSFDGTNWTDVTTATTAAIGATGQAYAYATVNVGSYVRAVNTGASTPVATNQVFVIFR
jgi:hypothetical protein